MKRRSNSYWLTTEKKHCLSAFAGSVVEWYDFTIFGALTPVLSSLFFPKDLPLISLTKTFAIFATGFIARPLGALILGWIGDRQGRKKALLISLLLATLSTTSMSMLPVYDHLGIMSTYLLILLRIMQGFGAGGEHAGAILLLHEWSDASKPIYRSSLSVLGIMMGVFLGFTVVAVLSLMLTPKEITKWGWRLPFLLGGLMGASGIYMRRSLRETDYFVNQGKKLRIADSIHEILKVKKNILITSGLYMHSVVIHYATFYYVPAYIATKNPDWTGKVSEIRWLCMVVFILLYFFLAKKADRIGSYALLRAGVIYAILLTLPLTILIEQGNIILYLIAQLSFTALNVIYLIPIASVFTEMFPMKIRYTGISFSINISSAIFGGLTPMVMTWLAHSTGKFSLSSSYMILAAVISLLSLEWARICKYGKL